MGKGQIEEDQTGKLDVEIKMLKVEYVILDWNGFIGKVRLKNIAKVLIDN